MRSKRYWLKRQNGIVLFSCRSSHGLCLRIHLRAHDAGLSQSLQSRQAPRCFLNLHVHGLQWKALADYCCGCQTTRTGNARGCLKGSLFTRPTGSAGLESNKIGIVQGRYHSQLLMAGIMPDWQALCPPALQRSHGWY